MPISVNRTDFPKLMASMVANARAVQASGGGGGGSRGPAVVHGGGGTMGSLGGTEEKSATQINAGVNLDPFLRLLGYKTQEEMINDENRFIELLNGMSKADQDKLCQTLYFNVLLKRIQK